MALTTNTIWKGDSFMADQKIPKRKKRVKIKIGDEFGRLVVIGEAGRSKNGHIIFDCVCDCGNKVPVFGSNLRRRHTESCGCIWQETMTKHGMCGTPTYQSWQHMIDRCNNPNNDQYYDYGGRGIKIEDNRWLKFEHFLEDMGERKKGLTIERKNNAIGYFKENCCWADRTAQARNHRIQANNKTGKVGVCWKKSESKYAAYIGMHNKTIHLGVFNCLSDAIQARKAAEIKYWNRPEV